MKSRSDNSPKNKVKTFHENLVVVEEEWFSGISLTGGATFPTAPTKSEKLRLNQKLISHVTQSDAYIQLQ